MKEREEESFYDNYGEDIVWVLSALLFCLVYDYYS